MIRDRLSSFTHFLTRPGCAAAVAAVIATAALAPPAGANGGTPRLTEAAAGPYLVSVWTQPTPLRVGQADVSVAVMRPPGAEPVLDATVRASGELGERPETRARAALTPGSGGSRKLYHGNLELPVAGRWRVTLAVEGPAGVGQADFRLDVEPGRSVDWRLVAVAVVLVALAVAWTVRRAPSTSESNGARPGPEA